jgi:hypothetical protein
MRMMQMAVKADICNVHYTFYLKHTKCNVHPSVRPSFLPWISGTNNDGGNVYAENLLFEEG